MCRRMHGEVTTGSLRLKTGLRFKIKLKKSVGKAARFEELTGALFSVHLQSQWACGFAGFGHYTPVCEPSSSLVARGGVNLPDDLCSVHLQSQWAYRFRGIGNPALADCAAQRQIAQQFHYTICSCLRNILLA